MNSLRGWEPYPRVGADPRVCPMVLSERNFRKFPEIIPRKSYSDFEDVAISALGPLGRFRSEAEKEEGVEGVSK